MNQTLKKLIFILLLISINTVLNAQTKTNKIVIIVSSYGKDMVEIIAVYGYYHANYAKDNLDKLSKAVAVMELVTPYYFNEDLYIPLSEYYLKLGDNGKAIVTLNQVIEKNPSSEKAKNLLKKLKG